MKTNESLYDRSIIEACQDPLVTINPHGIILDLNQANELLMGLDRKRIIGTSFLDYFPDSEKANQFMQLVFANSSVKEYSLTVRDTHDKQTSVLYTGSVYKDKSEEIIGAVLVARAIEQQNWAKELYEANKKLAFQDEEKEKRAAELAIADKELAFQSKEKEKRAAELVIADKELAFQSKEKGKRAAELAIADKELTIQNEEKEKRAAANKRLETFSYSLKLASQYARSLIEASHDPLFTINLYGKITDMNNASINIIGIPREKLIGTDFFEYFTEPQKAKEVYRDVFSDGFVTDFPLTMRDAKFTDVLFNGSVYKDDNGNVQGVVVVARDITEQKKIESQLNEAIVFAETATEIAEIAKSKAESSTLIAENAVKAKQQFLSNMSHEIRTPMNAIIGFTKVLLKTGLSSKQKEYLTAIKMSGDTLIVLINDILDLAKVDAGKMVFEQVPFKISLSISAMLHLFETKIQEKNLKLVFDYDEAIPDVLVGDPVRLHQIILNLVSNAVKFTSKGTITVCVKLISEDDEKVSIKVSVQDTGIGILKEKIGEIFDNFQQASSGTSRLYGGTGLGLAIVKQLVEPQGGSIEVISKVNEGSTFSFILSFLKTDAEAEAEILTKEFDTENNNIKVLVVEDIPLNQLLMKTLLDDFGFECDIAGNGKIAIEKMGSKSFDVILMDLQMPEMNGFEATDYIRNIMKSDIPIIALTADVTTMDLTKCKAVGMNDYIAKPVDEKSLYSKIVGAVKKQTVDSDDENEAIVPSNMKTRCTNLDYLTIRTKSNPALMMEMISLYLEQTPGLIKFMKNSMVEKDWNGLHSAVHKMIPSFAIMGISPEFENMAKKVQDYAGTLQQSDSIQDMITQLGNICTQACRELEEEYEKIKEKN